MARGRRSETREETGRRSRRLLGGADFKMTIPDELKEEGYEYRWFNDTKNRLSAAHEADWDHVEGKTHIGTAVESNGDDGGSRISMVVGTNEDGSPRRAYLMRKRKDWHEEDQREKLKAIDAMEDQLRQRITPDGGLGQDVSYGKVGISRG